MRPHTSLVSLGAGSQQRGKGAPLRPTRDPRIAMVDSRETVRELAEASGSWALAGPVAVLCPLASEPAGPPCALTEPKGK